MKNKNTIRTTFLFFALWMCAPVVFAQEALLFARFDQALYAINPAFSGMDTNWQLQAGYRKPYTGFNEGPNTVFIGGSGAITRYRGLFRDEQTLRISTSDEEASTLRRSGKNELRHGLGFFLSRYASGPFSTNRLSSAYSVHLPLTSKLRAAAGIGLELVNPRLDPGAIRPRDAQNDFVYFSLISVGSSRNFLNLDIGLSLYSDNFYVGYTAHGVTEAVIDRDNSTSTQVTDTFHSLVAGANFELGSALWKLHPSVLLSYSEINGLQPSLVVQAQWRQQVSGGLIYKAGRSAGVTTGFKYHGQYSFNYTYEFITSDAVSQFGNGSHEIILSFLLAPPQAEGPR